MALNLAFLNRSYPSLETFKVDQEEINLFSNAIALSLPSPDVAPVMITRFDFISISEGAFGPLIS